MIVRKYGRRSRDLERSFSGAGSLSGVISDSPSLECPQDVYNFTLSSQESARCDWSDPYAFDSGKEGGEFDEFIWKPKKLKVIDVESETYGSSSSQESRKLAILTSKDREENFRVFDFSDEGIQNPKKVKKFNSDPYGFDSSQDFEEIAVLPKNVVGVSRGFQESKKVKKVDSDPYEFDSSQDLEEIKVLPKPRGFQESKKFKKVDSDPYGFDSSQDLEELTVLPKKGGGGGRVYQESKVKKVDSDPYGFDSSQDLEEFTVLPKKGCGNNRGIQESKKFKKVDSDPYGFDSSQDVEKFTVSPKKRGREVDRSLKVSNREFRESEKFKNDSYGVNSSQELDELGISFTRKLKGSSSNSFEFDGISRKPKKKDRRENLIPQKKRNKNKDKDKKMKSKELGSGDLAPTATLMETQEFGEMMEHMDEVNFALDGLKKRHQVRIRRASLLSLLSVCGTSQQRRILRAHGMAKTIIDAVLGLSLDDQPCNLAAAALFYILTSDDQDDRLLDSPNCIRFLLNFLKPLPSIAAIEKTSTIGSKLLGMCKNTGFLQDSAKGTDTSCPAIMLKAQEILISAKDIKLRNDTDSGIEKPELNSKWISLLTMEKACLSSISIEDTFGPSRKSGGNFKEKLREFGGLDAVFEEARKCHTIMEKWLERSPTFAVDSKDIMGLESLALLLRCLKIMENATFLSNDNQCHLLAMRGKYDGQRTPTTFTKLILSLIKILSGVSLLSSSLSSSQDDKVCDDTFNLSSQSGGGWSMECDVEDLLQKIRAESSTLGSCSGTIDNSNTVINISSSIDSETQRMDESQDPFAFDDDEFKPSKWDLLSGNSNKQAKMSACSDVKPPLVVLSQQESNNSEEASCSSTIDDDKSILLGDCLLTAVKVLMNLTNDNSEGCRQIASSGGLEILSSLIAGHFSSFSLNLPQHFHDLRKSSLSAKSSPAINGSSNTNLSDQELDFLVAILGLLVNLVEKDGRNRSRLAAASVSIPSLENSDEEDRSDLISLLCSIFLSSQGDVEANGEAKCISLDDEDSVLQGEKEAEKMIVEAYAALLLAFLSTESKSVRDSIAECLPKRNIAILVPVLERFVEFHLTLNMISPETHTAVLEVIESCRIP